MLTTLPIPQERGLHFSKQVNQDTIQTLSKSILDINTADEQLTKIYKVYDLAYTPKPIQIYIDSYGGQLYQCFGLLSIMEASKVPIHTIVTGCAMSCGFMIAIHGHKRFGYEHSTYLYHQVSSGVIGKAKDIEEEFIEVTRLQKLLEEMVLRKTKISKDKLEKVYKTKKDWYINTKQALELKIIDEKL
jgi:ATP-dependent Clp protease protease subunit